MMKYIQIRHMKEREKGVWVNEVEQTLCDDSFQPEKILATELERLREGCVEGVLLTCVDMTEAEIRELGEFEGW